MLFFSPLHSQSRSLFLARVYSTHEKHTLNLFTESFKLTVFTFTFLCSQAFAAKLACAKDGWGSPDCSRMGGARAGGVVSSRSVSNSARECRLRLRCFARFANEFLYSIVKNISWEPAILLFAPVA